MSDRMEAALRRLDRLAADLTGELAALRVLLAHERREMVAAMIDDAAWTAGEGAAQRDLGRHTAPSGLIAGLTLCHDFAPRPEPAPFCAEDEPDA